MSTDPSKIEDCIEAIAQQGCQYTREVLAMFREGAIPSEVIHLSIDERAVVHAELKAVMDVYGEDCPIDQLINDAGLNH
jgi:hypothetical protein